VFARNIVHAWRISCYPTCPRGGGGATMEPSRSLGHHGRHCSDFLAARDGHLRDGGGGGGGGFMLNLRIGNRRPTKLIGRLDLSRITPTGGIRWKQSVTDSPISGMTFQQPCFVKGMAERTGAQGVTRVGVIVDCSRPSRRRLPTRACISSLCPSTTRRMSGVLSDERRQLCRCLTTSRSDIF